MLFVHEGSGVCDTIFGPLRYGPGDYLVLPIGTTWRLDPDEGSAQRILYLEAPSEIEPPKRYRNDYGQLLEHAPYSQRDLHAPECVPPRDDAGEFAIHVRSADRITAYHYRHHPFDVVGWDGYLWPFRFNIADFQPITGRVHQPPPVHQTFQARNFVVCSFVPRKFDYHPLAIPAPYNHSNINSDEVIYYVAGNFMSRRGVEIASFTLHPAGIPHGPHPGTVEASIGKEATEELAVMVDTFHPLHVTQAAMDLDDDRYPYSLAPLGRPRQGSLRARGARPGGVPGLKRSAHVVAVDQQRLPIRCPRHWVHVARDPDADVSDGTGYDVDDDDLEERQIDRQFELAGHPGPFTRVIAQERDARSVGRPARAEAGGDRDRGEPDLAGAVRCHLPDVAGVPIRDGPIRATSGWESGSLSFVSRTGSPPATGTRQISCVGENPASSSRPAPALS